MLNKYSKVNNKIELTCKNRRKEKERERNIKLKITERKTEIKEQEKI